MNRSLTIRAMTVGDLDFAASLAAAENWLSETRETFETSLAHFPEGCLIGEDDSGRVGMCVATPYGEQGFLGELIVIPSRRNLGYGRVLLEEAADCLRKHGCRSVALDGDLPAVPLYERLGFRPVCRSLRYMGRVESKEIDGAGALTESDLDEVIALDREAFGADRSPFLRDHFRRHGPLCRGLRRAGRLTGYVMTKPGRGIIAVGPWVVALDDPRPEDLLHDLAVVVGNAKLRLGILESNTRATDIVSSLCSLAAQPHCLRMVRGGRCDLGMLQTCLAVGSPAKG